MRRMLAAIGLAIVAVSACTACTSSPQTRHATSQDGGGGQGDAPVAGPGSTPQVCAAVRRAIAGDMTSLGSAVGSVVGSGAGKDAMRRNKAVEDVNTALRKIGTDIAAASAAATSDSVRAAADQAVRRVSALAADPTYLVGVDSMDAIPAVTAKLVEATAPIAAACASS